MKFDLDSFQEILATITKNKTRSLLTAFGVFWGIFMLVTLIGGGKGLENLMGRNFEGFAQNTGIVFTSQTSKAYKGFQKGRYWDLTLPDIDKVAKVEGVDVVTPSLSEWGVNVIYKDKKESSHVKGVYPNYQRIETPVIRYGRYINDIDIKEKRKVCYIGNEISDKLFGKNTNACGKNIQVNGITYKIIGISGVVTGNINVGGSMENGIAIPLTTFQNTYNSGQSVDLICFTAKKGYQISKIKDNIMSTIKRAHLIHPKDKQAVRIFNTEAMFQMVSSLFDGINILVWMIGLGTLIAGAIGVSNIMMITVKERTTEIGIRRAIGATPKIIMQQIISESILLTIVAGLSGLCFAVFTLQGLEQGVSIATKAVTPFQIQFWTAIGASLIVLILGTVAGLAPAYRAMKVKPVDAMRDE